MLKHSNYAVIATVAAALLGAATFTQAQTYPIRPVTIIYPYQIGGAGDATLRAVSTYLEKRWGQSIVIDPKPGGNEVVAMAALSNVVTDGYTIGVTSQNFSLNPAVQKVPYQNKDFTVITPYTSFSGILGVNPNMPVKNLAEFIAYVRSNPGKVNFGYIGNFHKVALAHLSDAGKISFAEVPFKGSPDALNAFFGGHINAFFFSGTQADTFQKEGKVRYLAATTPARLLAWPDLPTVGEAIPGFSMVFWLGLVAKTGTPRPVLERWNAGIKEAVTQPDVLKIYQNFGFLPAYQTLDEAAAYIAKEGDTLARAAKLAGLSPE